jgi:hypothetical protein
MGVMSKGSHQLQSMCVWRGIHKDVVREAAQLLSRGQLAVDEQEGYLKEGGLFG